MAAEEMITLVINGKLRDRVGVPVSILEAEAWDLALQQERVKARTQGKNIAQVIYVPGRPVNVVVK